MGAELRDGIRDTTRTQVLWATMLVLTTIATLVALVTSPLSADEGEFIHALRSGEITAVAVGHSADFFSGPTVGITFDADKSEDDIAVAWVNRFGLRRGAVLENLKGIGDLAAASPSGSDLDPAVSAVDPSASIVRTARSLGAAAPRIVRPGDLPFDRYAWLSALLTVIMIGLMLNGPQPRRMTRWAAFWAYLFPFNLGIWYSLLRDSPWNERMNRLPEPAPGVPGVVVDPATGKGVRRYGGVVMFFLIPLLFGIAISVLLGALGWAFPRYLDPVVWTAVDLAGKPITQ